MKSGLEKSKEIALRIAEQLGYELYQVQLLKESGNRILRITIDHPEGISHTDCERFSRAIDPVLTIEDPIAESYFLEISSPGLERELRNEKDYQRFLGAQVRVLCKQAVDDKKTHQGALISYSEDEIVLKQEQRELPIPRSLIKKMHLDIL